MSDLRTIETKLADGQRLDHDDAIALMTTHDIYTLGRLATAARTRHHGENIFYGSTLNLNPTNICELRCPLCAFSRDPGEDGAYFMEIPQVAEYLSRYEARDLTEVHIVGGLCEQVDLAYILELLDTVKRICPDVYIQGMTAVEVAEIAKREGASVPDILHRLKDHGLDAIPGGGAEIFSPRVRELIAPKKLPADDFLTVHRQAHELGIRSNITMLYGHVETMDEQIEHILAVRKLQDDTGGLISFVPIAFHSPNTQVTALPADGITHLRILATARLLLDNVPHLRCLWNYVGIKLAQVAIAYGADDLGSTSLNEKIASAAGARRDTEPSTDLLKRCVTELGLTPVLTNSGYTNVPPMQTAKLTIPAVSDQAQTIAAKIDRGERLDADEGERLFELNFTELGHLADLRRQRVVGNDQVGYVIDRNITFANICEAACKFCAFYKRGGDQAYRLSIPEILDKVDELVRIDGTQIMLQGGLCPENDLKFYCDMLSAIKQRHPHLHLHSLSPAEIHYLSKREDMSVRDVIAALIDAGLDSLPGAAEILVDDVRQDVSPKKLRTDDWLNIMRTAHELGIHTTATMTFGMGEALQHRIEHLIRIRELQDETGVFKGFIPWTFSPERTRMSHIQPSLGVDYLRTLAVSRIMLDNFPHVHAGWVTEGLALGQIALYFGADDFGGILMEEVVVKSTGISHQTNVEEIIRLINAAGRTPVQRNSRYEPLRLH